MDNQKPTSGRTISLIITHQCNLNCVYCYEKHKSNKHMDLEMAKAIISREYDIVKQSDKYNAFEVDFFGGEPLLEFELIRQVTDWIIEQSWDIPHRLFVVTNGTLLNPEMKAYFSERRDLIALGLSYDGLPEMQDINRSQSFQMLDLDFFLENYPTQPIKMTISKESLPYMAEGVLFLQRKGFIVQPSCGNGPEWTEEDCREYERQLYILAQTYLNDPELTPIDELLTSFAPILQPAADRPPCGAGDNFETFDVDGSRYPCHMFTPLVQIESISEKFKNMDEGVSGKTDPQCKNCILVNMCTSCRGYNLSRFGACDRRDLSLCKMFQSRCRVSSWFQLQSFQKKKSEIKDCTPEEMQEWKGILFYQRHLDQIGYGRE